MLHPADLNHCVEIASQSYGVARGVLEELVASALPQAGSGIGLLHIPEQWRGVLSRVGFRQLDEDRCSNIAAGAWIMAYVKLPAASIPVTPPSMSASSGRATPLTPANLASVADYAGVPESCVAAAAATYHLPISVFVGVLATEHARVGDVSANANGSYDIGPAQINSSWLPELSREGITRQALLNDGCLNIRIGARILANELAGASLDNPNDYWRRIGNYNSHTPSFNAEYQRRVWSHIAPGAGP
jgi:hypothetical protein